MAASQAAWLNLERKDLEIVLVWVSLGMAAMSAEKLDLSEIRIPVMASTESSVNPKIAAIQQRGSITSDIEISLGKFP